MRTTIRLDDDLLAQAKQHAAQTGKTLTAVLEHALRESLARRRSRAPGPRVRLKTFKGGGVRPGVDLDDSASLLDLMAGKV
ncbi:MAG: type II toxin-antitoxin system VapB family antitoxin [Burkholderiales bacterium]|nr:type II toxin-antitoxin system VapB family antitoxin [Burkholderiales bacterium]